MDAHITKKRIGHMLSYDWIKILAIAAAAIVLWSLLFTMTATRATIGQTFYLYSFYDVTMKNSRVNSLDYLKENGALSYDILDLSDYTFMNNDYLAQIMASYFSVSQGDVLFITDIRSESEEEETYSNLQSFASSYYSILAPLGSDLTDRNGASIKKDYFEECEAYLNNFYGGDFENGELDTGAVDRNFDTRMKKDKRFKNEKQKAEGRENEAQRIENLRNSYLNVRDALENGIISVKDTVIAIDYNGDGNVSDDEWQTINCAFDLSNISNITDYVSNGQSENSQEGLCMAIFDWSDKQYDLQFEPITFLDFLITNYHKTETA